MGYEDYEAEKVHKDDVKAGVDEDAIKYILMKEPVEEEQLEPELEVTKASTLHVMVRGFTKYASYF